MKTIIFAMIALISTSTYAQESAKIIKLKSSEVETVTGVLDVLKDDKNKRPSSDKMAEAIFKRIDVDKNGSLSFKEFQTFFTRIRSDRSDRARGSDRPRSGRPDRSKRPDGDDSRRKTQGFGKDKKDRGPDK